MNTNRQNFECWYKKPLAMLYPDRDCGFVILLVAFPLLERYLRHKSGSMDQKLKPPFYHELGKLFPMLKPDIRGRFWDIYRNGLLHQIVPRSRASLSHDKAVIEFENDGTISIHPVEFAQRVIEAIESDFATFEGPSSSATRLPTVKREPITNAGTPQAHRWLLSTNTSNN
jgi:hypothetical protein